MKSFALALTLGATLAAAAGQSQHVTLASLRDHQRALLVFANGDNRLAETQLNVAADNVSGFCDRDLILVGLQGSKPNMPTALFSPKEDAAARQRFHVQPGQFTVILIGKDGGEKLRSTKPILWQTLQQSIDSMPMRKDELKRSAH